MLTLLLQKKKAAYQVKVGNTIPVKVKNKSAMKVYIIFFVRVFDRIFSLFKWIYTQSNQDPGGHHDTC